MPNIYMFYELPEEKRFELIGSRVVEHQPHFKKSKVRDRIFYPIYLSEGCFNYGSRCGLLGVIEPLCLYYTKKYNGDATWTKIYVKSPDDLDLGLEFHNNKYPEKLYNKILDFLDEWSPTFVNVSYREALEFCQKELGGEIG